MSLLTNFTFGSRQWRALPLKEKLGALAVLIWLTLVSLVGAALIVLGTFYTTWFLFLGGYEAMKEWDRKAVESCQSSGGFALKSETDRFAGCVPRFVAPK